MATEMNNGLNTLVQNGHVNPVLEIANGQFIFRGPTEGGTVVEKCVSPATVREAFSGVPVDSGWFLPCVAGVARWGVVRGGEVVVFYIPPAVHAVEMTENDGTPEQDFSRVSVPLPGMVMVGNANKYFAFAQKTPTFDPHYELYRAPLPNVMEDGSICWGSNKPPHASGSSVHEAWALFAYKTTFNNHAVNAKSAREPEDVRRLLRALAAEGGPYPVDDLRRQHDGGGLTLNKVMRGVFGGRDPEEQEDEEFTQIAAAVNQFAGVLA